MRRGNIQVLAEISLGEKKKLQGGRSVWEMKGNFRVWPEREMATGRGGDKVKGEM